MKKTVFWSCVFLFIGSSAMAQHHQGHMMHQEMDHHREEMTGQGNVGICPVMGNPAREKYSYSYKGKTYYFCCPMCIGQFKKNPGKYISKIKEIPLAAYQFGYEPSEITVSKGDIVRFLATSRDVPHGVYIEEYGINATLKKGEMKEIEFIADKAGEFPILCSVYCGRGHHTMRAKLIVKESGE